MTARERRLAAQLVDNERVHEVPQATAYVVDDAGTPVTVLATPAGIYCACQPGDRTTATSDQCEHALAVATVWAKDYPLLAERLHASLAQQQRAKEES